LNREPYEINRYEHQESETGQNSAKVVRRRQALIRATFTCERKHIPLVNEAALCHFVDFQDCDMFVNPAISNIIIIGIIGMPPGG